MSPFVIEAEARPEAVLKFSYNMETGVWQRTECQVIISTQSFDAGSMRAAFFMIDLSVPWSQARCVAKLSLDPTFEPETAFLEGEMQALSSMFAMKFNEHDPPKKIYFVPVSVIQCLDREGQPYLATEPFMEGEFRKQNNNFGFVSGDDRNTPQAFSHFSYHFSKQSVLVCDIQGVGDMYTDPQIHSADGKGFGKANLGKTGITKFFQTHHCNEICRMLGVPLHNPKRRDRGTMYGGPNPFAAAQRAKPQLSAPPAPVSQPTASSIDLPEEEVAKITASFKRRQAEGTEGLRPIGFTSLCGELSHKVTFEEAEDIFELYDTSNTGIMTLDQFLGWWSGVKAGKQQKGKNNETITTAAAADPQPQLQPNQSANGEQGSMLSVPKDVPEFILTPPTELG
eukprot:NODE_1090_length_1711_cov_27.432611_g966_i0.p1 GENE.NODE_1090_length_1711_cov_27.432611_g966_i0~~NODE_1090_length_1711_cov_27.432611_g966_i0.p1  ORF type:complete len:397 (-),score=78.97 NODE_1090_length_1711_cov_27.432611_g966_i0:332-1522(-)